MTGERSGRQGALRTAGSAHDTRAAGTQNGHATRSSGTGRSRPMIGDASTAQVVAARADAPDRAVHWPEYLIEAMCIALFMLSVCVFGTLFEHPGSPIRRAI